MLTARCPSCSAPVRFNHAATVMAVCESCSSAVVRSGQDVALFGKVAKFARDLSPIRVGAHGAVGKRDFTVIGVLRKARKAVRWNEWFLSFHDGEFGWLSEGNGEWQLFDSPPLGVNLKATELRPSARVEAGERKWVVIERASATIAAAEGELPFAVKDKDARAYADLRSLDGRFTGTIDFADSPPTLWQGRLTDLVELKLEGLRPIAGWSDPTLVEMSGPEITAVRTLRCPNCGASLNLRAPGQAVRISCEYCGSSLGLEEKGDASEAILLAKAEANLWKPGIDLGKRGTLGGVDWEIIGAMRRSVTAEGTEYPWTEFFLFNPYRGFAWLVESNGHFNLVKRIGEVPRGNWANGTPSAVKLKDDYFRHFQGGYARVRSVLGEFTWEVAVNDMAETEDFISPPRMLSLERLSDEVTWTLGEYVETPEVEAAFGVKFWPRGVAANQPNPYARSGLLSVSLLSTALVLIATLLIGLGVSARAVDELILETAWGSTPTTSDEVFLSPTFGLTEDMPRNLHLVFESEVSSDAIVHLALMNQSDGTARLYPTDEGNDADIWIRDADPGNYLLRAEIARPPGTLSHPAEPLRLTVHRDPPYYGPLFWLALYALLAPIFVLVARNAFETKRWANSDHAP